MTSCPHTGCNSPQSECTSGGACMQRQPAKHFKPQTQQQQLKITRRINDVEHDMSINLAKPPLRYFPKPRPVDLSVGDDEPINRFRLALNTFNLYRRHGCGLRQSLRKALKALGGKF